MHGQQNIKKLPVLLILCHNGMSYNRDEYHTSIKSFNKINLIIACFDSY